MGASAALAAAFNTPIAAVLCDQVLQPALVERSAGDTATDYNWYTKRMILASVISATKLYWLGDQSTDYASTWAFLDRRLDDVMQFEKTKAAFQKNPLARAVMWGPSRFLGLIRPPGGRRGPSYPPS